jgi:hypothetical protein
MSAARRKQVEEPQYERGTIYRNTGHAPELEGKVRVRFAGGLVARHTYTPDQLRWKIEGDDFDIRDFRMVEHAED